VSDNLTLTTKALGTLMVKNKRHMIEQSLFNIPYYTTPILDFKVKKKKLVNLLKSYPEKKHGMQTFFTNRQSNRDGLVEGFTELISKELNMLTQKIKAGISIMDVWSVTYAKNDYHSPHNHGSTGLAGILYLDLPKDSPITSYIQPWQDYVNDTTIFNPLLVTEGEIVIVPQSVLHFSSPNKSINKKRIISWDMNILPQE
jgi:hypothetical protein|tara:strand:+ start:44 stop:643 length:600 start_codon:yes stop_codon:yes gene_type:complete